MQYFKQHRRILIISAVGIFLAMASFYFGKMHVEQNTASLLLSLQQKFKCGDLNQVYFGEKPNPQKAQLAISLLDDTNRLFTKNIRTYQKSSGTTKLQLEKQLLKTMVARKKFLFEAMQRDPRATLLSLVSSNDIAVARELAENCVEVPVTIEGSLEVIHADFFEEKTSDTVYFLNTGGNSQIQIHPAGPLRIPLESKTKVRVKGMLVDNHLIFDATQSIGESKDNRGGIDLISQPGNPPVLGEQKIVVLLVNFQNTTQPGFTAIQLKDFLTNKLAPYYTENAYNKISVSGDVFGWYTLSINHSCSNAAVIPAAIQAADNDVYFPNYNRLIVVAPFSVVGDPTSCGWGGMADIGKTIISTADGTMNASWAMITSSQSFSLFVVGHELGHGFGNYHATSLDCGDQTISLSGGCTYYEYGDGYDIMGRSSSVLSAFHFNAQHKEWFGWIETANIKTITASGVYTIEPFEIASLGAKTLKIERAPFGDYLYIEYRQPIGFDVMSVPYPEFSLTNVYQGALLHGSSVGPRTTLLDPSPLNDSQSTIALSVGSSFVDPGTGTKITVISANSSGLTVDIVLGKTDFTRPSVSIDAPLWDEVVFGTIPVRVSASDASGIEKVEFLWQNSVSPLTLFATDTSAPYEAVLDTNSIANGSTYIYAYAYDLSGVPYGIPGNRGVTSVGVTVNNGVDASPPSITLISPANGATVANPVSVSVSATDNIGVWKVELFKDTDPTPFAAIFSPPYSSTVTLTDGLHSIYAKAYDFAGNSSISSTSNITVSTVDSIQPSVSINNPVNGSYVQGNVSVSASATDNVGVVKVEFYSDASAIPFSFDTTSPYEALWDTTSLSSGSHSLKSKAYDAAGNNAESTVQITVDNVLPIVNLTAPLEGATVSGASVTIAASATDNLGIGRVDFYRDADVLIGSDTVSPYSIVWNSTAVANGSHIISAKSVDKAGNLSAKSSRTISVNNSDIIQPTISITYPNNNSTVLRNANISITASASDNVGITKVEFLINGGLKCTDTLSPYSCLWRVPNQKNVRYTIQAKAYDKAGNVGTHSIAVTAK